MTAVSYFTEHVLSAAHLCFTWITSKRVAGSSSRRSANSIWKVSSRSRRTRCTGRRKSHLRTGSRSRTATTRKPKAAESYLINRGIDPKESKAALDAAKFTGKYVVPPLLGGLSLGYGI